MAKDYKYEDSTPVDEPVRRGKIKTQQPGSGIRVRPLSDMERAEEMSKLKEMRAAKFSPEAMEARYDAANPDKYSSVRPTGFSKDLSRLKDMASDRTKDAAVNIGKGAVKSTMIPGVGSAAALGDFSKGARELEMGQRLRDTAKSMQGSADREMTDQIRRESRGVKDDSLRGKFSELTGMKKGGMTASSRADGCCTKGKTRGKMM